MRGFELRSARFLAADCLRQFLLPGDIAVDATMGNGHDTEALCRLVGDRGRVYAFDIQLQAAENTRIRLREAGLFSRAVLHCRGHEHMAECVPAPVQAVVFNLGWLPGGEKTITTRLETTMSALSQALQLLSPGGLCVLCVYPGHAEGRRELERIVEYLSQLKPQEYNVLRQTFLNAGPGAPECFIVQKQG